jgi:preprotein translocase subunit SecG
MGRIYVYTTPELSSSARLRPAMQTPLLIAQMILAIALLAAILLQQRGTGLGGAFGGEVTAYRSRRGIERTLFRMTIVLAVLFVAFSLLNLLPQP